MDSRDPKTPTEQQITSSILTVQERTTKYGNVALFRRSHSARWQARIRRFFGKWFDVSTNTSDVETAKHIAGNEYDGMLPPPDTGVAAVPEACATLTSAMKFCSHCGHELSFTTPPGDHLPRFVCTACDAIHYQNPKLVSGCVAEWQGKILICKRAIEPRAGLWTLPAGFMENGETTEAAAARETAEEALAEVGDLQPFALVNVPHVNQVHLMFRAVLKDGRHAPGPESLDTRLVEERDIPWAEIAFPSVRFTLERYLHDRSQGRFGFHITTWERGR